MKLIIHILIHNFFVTAANAENAELAGKPVAIVKKNHVIDVSPEAHGFGLLPGITRSNSARLCPSVRFVQLSDETVNDRKAILAAQCYNLTPRVEIIGENEVFIDLSGSKPPGVGLFHNLVKNLVPHLGNSVTITTAPNRLLAKAAAFSVLTSSICKKPFIPPGMAFRRYDKLCLYIVRNETAGNLTSSLPVEAMWPLDSRLIKRLKSLGLKTFGDISHIPLTMLYRQFGSAAPLVKNYSQGIDESTVPVFHPPDRAVYHMRCEGTDRAQLENILKQAAVFIYKTLQEKGKSYRELTLTIFFDDGCYKKKISTFARGKSELSSVYHDSVNLLNKTGLGGNVTEITLTAGQLITSSQNQLALFTDPAAIKTDVEQCREKLAKVCADLAAKYSAGVVTTGKNLTVSRREQMLMFIDPLRMVGLPAANLPINNFTGENKWLNPWIKK